MKRVLSIFGTRPEAIKMAPVIKAVESSPELENIVAVTAQHRQMLDQVLDLFEIRPDYDLNIMKPGQDLYDITSRVLIGTREIITEAKPDIVLVHGDTTTCFAAALGAFYSNIPVGHVEAGLRTGNLRAPFPEEANRSLVGRIADIHFAPTETARRNLLAEGISDCKICVTGNTVVDALLMARNRLEGYQEDYWREQLGDMVYSQVAHRSGKMILITGHRRENFGQGFLNFCTAISNLAEQHPDWLFIYPVHLNPNVQTPVQKILNKQKNILLTQPADYLPFVWLMNECDLVLTDSGGIQEEAPSLGKPVVVTREVTERPEAVEAGTVKLVGTNGPLIEKTVTEILTDPVIYQVMSRAHNPYGDGFASQKIRDSLAQN
jgi:UDP-N-acetylglucosamine 2-epimerase (non-hydrolysing)